MSLAITFHSLSELWISELELLLSILDLLSSRTAQLFRKNIPLLQQIRNTFCKSSSPFSKTSIFAFSMFLGSCFLFPSFHPFFCSHLSKIFSSPSTCSEFRNGAILISSWFCAFLSQASETGVLLQLLPVPVVFSTNFPILPPLPWNDTSPCVHLQWHGLTHWFPSC